MKINNIPANAISQRISTRWSYDISLDAQSLIIMDSVAISCGLDISELVCQRRSAGIAIPRIVSMALCRCLTGLTHQRIAHIHCRNNHATAVHAHKKAQRYSQFRAMVHDIESHLPPTL